MGFDYFVIVYVTLYIIIYSAYLGPENEDPGPHARLYIIIIICTYYLVRRGEKEKDFFFRDRFDPVYRIYILDRTVHVFRVQSCTPAGRI